MIIFLSGLQTIPDEMYEAARIDGASPWQVFQNVTWPLLTPSVNTNLTLNIIGSLQAWQLFLVLLGYKQGTQVLGYLIYATGFGHLRRCLSQFPPGICGGSLDRPVLVGAGDRYGSAILFCGAEKRG